MSKDGVKLDDKVLNEGDIYNFNNMFITKIYRVWTEPASDVVELTDAVMNLANAPQPTFTATPATTATEKADIGYISVWSIPDGGSTYVDGDYMGLTDSMRGINIPATTGYHTVEIYKDGYFRYSTSVYVSAGQSTLVYDYLISPWELVNAILAMLLISIFVLFIGKAIKWSLIEKFILFLLVGLMALMVLLQYVSDSIEVVFFIALFYGLLFFLWYVIIKIGERVKKLIKGETALRLEHKELHREKPMPLSIGMEYLEARGIEKPIPTQKYKIKGILFIILLIVIGSIGYTFYQKYSPLAELANCSNNCIDYKKVRVAQHETSVPDIKITNADTEKLIMVVPIIIRNPSAKDTETVKIDFDLYMEGKNLTKGTIPAYELPAMQNTTILIKDVVIKYEELREVFQVVATRHGNEIFREGKANISMTTDLLIYLPIEVFSINIYTFTIPIQIETEIPVDMLKQNEEANKQIEEKVKIAIKEVQDKTKGVLPTATVIPTSIPTLPSLPTSTPTPFLPKPTLPKFP